jgi:hypothetical protein
MGKGSKEKTPVSEKAQARLAKAVTDKGFAISDANNAGAKGDARYRAEASVSAKGNGSKALAMKQSIKASRGRSATQVVETSVASAKDEAAKFGIAARSGLSSIQRKARSAQNAVRGANTTLQVGGAIASADRAKAQAEFVRGNEQWQAGMDLVNVGVSEGLGAKWDKEAVDKKKKIADAREIDTYEPINLDAVNQDPYGQYS